MEQPIYFGTYTKNLSSGIYRAFLDTDSKRISPPKKIISVGNPTYLKITPQNTLLAVNAEGNYGGISHYDLKDDSFILLDDPLSSGSSPCYVGWDAQRSLVFAAYYHRGTVEIYKLNSNQTLSKTAVIKHTGKSIRKEQERSHPHYANLTPDQKLVIADLGNDTLSTYELNPNGTPKEKSTLHLPAGFGPRHLIFDQTGEYAYLVGELSSQVATLKYYKANSLFKILDLKSTLPNNFKDFNGAATIRKFQDNIYVSNRGHDSIAHFKIQSDHTLKLIEHTSTQGQFPRDFALDNSEKFLVVANQKSNDVSLFTVDQQSGKLSCIQEKIFLPEGVCVCFK